MTPEAAQAQSFDLEERLLEFGAVAIRLAGKFQPTFAGKHVAAQIIRSSTSPMAHHAEGQAARSREDFLSKFRVALQELRETRRWMLLAARVPLLDSPGELAPAIAESEELIRIFRASIRTAQDNATNRVREDEPCD